jgi:hypothetical protein
VIELDDELGAYRAQMSSLRGRAPTSSSGGGMPLSPLKALIAQQAATPTGDISLGDIDHLSVPNSSSNGNNKSSRLIVPQSNGAKAAAPVPYSATDERLGEGIERRLQQAMDRAYAS